MKESKLASYIGFAIKSGKVIFGYDNLFKSKKLPRSIICCSTLSEKMKNKLISYSNDKKIKLLTLENLILSDIIKRDNCKVLGICDENLSFAIEYEIVLLNGKNSSEVSIGK